MQKVDLTPSLSQKVLGVKQEKNIFYTTCCHLSFRTSYICFSTGLFYHDVFVSYTLHIFHNDTIIKINYIQLISDNTERLNGATKAKPKKYFISPIYQDFSLHSFASQNCHSLMRALKTLAFNVIIRPLLQILISFLFAT